jgi:hypothetical protein
MELVQTPGSTDTGRIWKNQNTPESTCNIALSYMSLSIDLYMHSWKAIVVITVPSSELARS